MSADGDNLGAVPVVGQWIKFGSRLGHALFPGTSPADAGRSIASVIVRSGVIQSVLGQLPRPAPRGGPGASSGSGPPTFPSSQASTRSASSRQRMGVHYRGKDGKWYPYPPRDWSGTREQWEAVCRSRGYVYGSRAEAESAGRKKFGIAERPTPTQPPKPPAPEPRPQSPDAPKGPNFDVFPWLWLGQTIWANIDEVTRAVYRQKLHIPTPKPVQTPQVPLPTDRFPGSPQLPPMPLTVPSIYRRRMRVPKRRPAPAPGRITDTLSVPTITARPLPMPKPSPTPRPMPVLSTPRSVLGGLQLDPLTGLYLLTRQARSNLARNRALEAPLTRPQSNPLTSSLGAFAGVPSQAECSCSKSPKKRGKRKARTVCYEGTYRENARGIRKLRRREVPCT
jgi:hypothetical protein